MLEENHAARRLWGAWLRAVRRPSVSAGLRAVRAPAEASPRKERRRQAIAVNAQRGTRHEDILGKPG